jgi:hypothetical protein
VIKLAPPWQEAAVSDGEALAFTHAELGVRLSTTYLGDRFSPPHATGAALRTMDVTSALGWPMQVTERETDGDMREIEVRYALFELGGSVRVTGPAEVIASHFDVLVAATSEARPDWGGEPISVSEIFAAPR